jgi:hypothetical protein
MCILIKTEQTIRWVIPAQAEIHRALFVTAVQSFDTHSHQNRTNHPVRHSCAGRNPAAHYLSEQCNHSIHILIKTEQTIRCAIPAQAGIPHRIIRHSSAIIRYAFSSKQNKPSGASFLRRQESRTALFRQSSAIIRYTFSSNRTNHPVRHSFYVEVQIF